MLCGECGKKNASVHLTKIVNGGKTEIYLCDSCAREKGELEFPFEGKFPLHQFFSGLIGLVPAAGSDAPASQRGGVQCSGCGLTYAQFGQIGRFGCDRCYDSFGENLHSLFRRLHSNQKHVGKIPARACSHLMHKREIEELKRKLQESVMKEEFEEAARLRDRIRKLEEGVSSGGDSDG